MWILALSLGCQPAAEPAPERACNGAVARCERRFDEVTLAVTHNAMSAEDAGFRPPNQGHDIDQQLADGVRGFLLDVWDDDGVTSLCHGYCELGSEPLVDGLGRYRRFLDAHPDEVVMLLFERYVPPEAMAVAFADAGLLQHLHTQEVGAPWPTLGALLEAGTPLVVFDQDPVDAPAWLHHAYTFGFDTDYRATSPDELRCEPYRGDPNASLFLLNHFLTDPVAMPGLADEVNFDPFLSERIDACAAANGQVPDWIAVDFYERGDLLAAVERLNRAAEGSEAE